MKIAIFGNGFIGSFLHQRLPVETILITRDNYHEHVGNTFDVFINCAGNNKAFLANQEPHIDFIKSVSSVYNTFFDFKIDKYMYLSSIAVYDNDSNYGFNKTIAEEIIQRYSSNYIIYRTCTTIDKSSNIGIVADIVNNNPLFVSANSKIQFITRQAILEVINESLKMEQTQKVYNLGGIGSVQIRDIENIINRSILYKPVTTDRIYEMDVSLTVKDFNFIKTTNEYVKDILC